MAAMDIAVDLTESFLRLAGYLTLTEFEVQQHVGAGRYETVTDIDILGVRFPGADTLAEQYKGPEADMLLLDDPGLRLEEDRVDVIIGEVKQGPAEFNPGLKKRGVLESVLRRLEWLYGESCLHVVNQLLRKGVSYSPGRGELGRIRTRLVAFGRSPRNDLHTISLDHMIGAMTSYFSKHEDALRPIQFRDPVPALLRLMLKTGMEIGGPERE